MPKFSKRAMSPLSIGSSGKKSALQELHMSKGTSHFDDAVISSMFAISSALGSILKSQGVLLDKIECIAQKMEILSKEVTSLKENQVKISQPVETTSPRSLEWPSDQEMMAWLSSPMFEPDHGTFPDITCYETL